MKNVMSILAGLAIGYFAYQYFVSHAHGRISGRLHKSAADKKLAGVCGGIAAHARQFLIRCALVQPAADSPVGMADKILIGKVSDGQSGQN